MLPRRSKGFTGTSLFIALLANRIQIVFLCKAEMRKIDFKDLFSLGHIPERSPAAAATSASFLSPAQGGREINGGEDRLHCKA